MGACNFGNFVPETDVREAFRQAVAAAAWESGHGGYTGTIAEKDSYVVVSHKPMTLEEAGEAAYNLLRADDPRVSDKWGPAGAIRVVGGEARRVFRSGLSDDPRTGWHDEVPDGWYFFGLASS
jgi:hypothetical protein